MELAESKGDSPVNRVRVMGGRAFSISEILTRHT